MAFIGNTNTTQAFTPAIDYFSGNGSTTAFTLSRPVASVAQVQVVVNNVAQNPSSAYTVSGNTITFTSAPSSGTNNIYVYYTSPITQVIAPSQGTVNTTSLGTITNIASGSSSLTLQTGASNTTAMTIDTSQNVGIGTSSPNKKLEVLGAGEIIRATSNNAAADQLISVKNNSGTADCSTNIFFADRYAASSYASSYIRGTTSGISALIFATGGTNFTNIYDAGAPTERMRIDSSGNVGIGLTPSYRLSVLDSAAGARVVDIQNTASTGNPIMQYSTMTVTGTTSNYFFVGRANASDRVYIYGSGNIVNVNNSYGALSDVKLKENITDATPKLADLMRVKVRNYNLIGETQKQIGVVAQELEQVFPSMVDETIDRDTEGNELETTTKSVKYSVFVPMLIKAIQEQQALITALTARIEALEAK